MYLLFLTCYSFIFFCFFCRYQSSRYIDCQCAPGFQGLLCEKQVKQLLTSGLASGEASEEASGVSRNSCPRKYTCKPNMNIKIRFTFENTEMYHSVWKFPTFLRTKTRRILFLSFWNSFFKFENLCRPFLMFAGKLCKIFLNFTQYIRARKNQTQFSCTHQKRSAKIFKD